MCIRKLYTYCPHGLFAHFLLDQPSADFAWRKSLLLYKWETFWFTWEIIHQIQRVFNPSQTTDQQEDAQFILVLGVHTWREARRTVSASISNQCIINIATTLRNNESNTSHKVMKKMRQEWLISLQNCLIIVVHFSRERAWLYSDQPVIRICNHKSLWGKYGPQIKITCYNTDSIK